MKLIFRVLAALVILLFNYGDSLQAQDVPAYAIKDVIIHKTDGSTIESGTVVWRNGVVEEVGSDVDIPFDAFVYSFGDSLHLYPGFVNGFATWGAPKQPSNFEQLPDPGNPPYHRAGIQPERVPSELLEDDKAFEAAMKAGFTTAALGLDGNMLTGQVEVFTLSPGDVKANLFGEEIALHGSFDSAPGGWSSGAYPSTQMGVMARFRQLMYDAEALQSHIEYHKMNSSVPVPARDQVLEALFPLLDKSAPLFFTVDDKEDIERLFSYQDEFGFEVIIVSGKEAYAKAAELKERNIPVLASIDVTDAPDWYVAQKDTSKKKKEVEEISEEEQKYRDRQLEAWKAEVKNIKLLMDAGVKVGFTSEGLELKDTSKKVKILLDEGELTPSDLIRLMTINTAQILGIDQSFGSIETGKNASFTVFDKPLFEEKAKALYSISNGTINEF